MEFNVENSGYIAKCPKCSEIIKFTIDYNNFCINVKCRKGHNKKNISFKNFDNNYIQSTNIYKSNCSRCYNIINDDSINYKCQICNKLYCANCINKHSKEFKHNNIIKYFYEYQLCKKHNQKYSLFCEICRENICLKCKELHKNHSFKLFYDVIPNSKDKTFIKINLNEFEKKINKISKLMISYKEKVLKRFNMIEDFLNFLSETNDKLVNNFNNNYFDYYNFENFNYLLNSVNNNFIFDSKRYIDYLLLKDQTHKETKLSVMNYYLKNRDNWKNAEYISDFRNLKYLTNNVFYAFENKILKLFEFKPAKYSHYFFLNFKSEFKIKFLKYDLSKKIIKLSKKQIKDKNIDINLTYSIHFQEYFDNINRNILTYNNHKIQIWKESENDKLFELYLIIDNIRQPLFNLHPSIFGYQDYNHSLNIYNIEKYQLIGKIKFDEEIQFIGSIGNQVLVFTNNFCEDTLYIIDIKYLEIVQIVNGEYNPNLSDILIKGDYIITFYSNSDDLIIKRRFFNQKEKYVKLKEIIKRKLKFNPRNIFITENGYYALCTDDKIKFLSKF